MTTEHLVEESKRVSLMIAKRHLSRALDELEWLINAVPTGSIRDKLCDANIRARACQVALEGMTL